MEQAISDSGLAGGGATNGATEGATTAAGASLSQRAWIAVGAILLVGVVVLTFRAYLDPAMLIDIANLRFCS